MIAYKINGAYGIMSYNHFFNSGWCDPDGCTYWIFKTMGM